jgi:hypothetical protein
VQDRLEEFLTGLANNVGADQYRAYNHGLADYDLSRFDGEVNSIYRYEANGLLYTGRTHPAPHGLRCDINMIEVALRPAGVARWRTT